MGLFDMFKKPTAAVPVDTVENTLNTHKVNLDKSIVSLQKKSGIDLGTHKARVVAVMDYSGSMSSRFTDFGAANANEVQRTLTKLFPFALKFDDNGELDVWLFSDSKKRLTEMSTANYASYVNDIAKRARMEMGGTQYAPVIKDIMSTLVDDSSVPVYVLFVTDGDNFDKDETDRVIRESAEHNIFIQFIGIGGSRFDYLQKLDNLSGRSCDNTGFCEFRSIADATDSEVYDTLISEYSQWLKVRELI